MIEIQHLTKSYRIKTGRHFVFKDVSVTFPERRNIGILGPNGSGKSTFLRILGGIDYPDSGQVRTLKSISWPLGIQGGFVGHLSGRDNCKFVCTIYGVSSLLMREKLAFIHNLSGIGDYFFEQVRTYSSGMRARLGFALSMAFDFEYFLIDEVTAVGDRIFRKITSKALAEKREKSNIIMVSHQMKTLKEFCDVGVLIRNGEIKIFETMDEAIKTYEKG